MRPPTHTAGLLCWVPSEKMHLTLRNGGPRKFRGLMGWGHLCGDTGGRVWGRGEVWDIEGRDKEGNKILSIKINKFLKVQHKHSLKPKRTQILHYNIAQTRNLLSNATERNKQTYTKNKAKQTETKTKQKQETGDRSQQRP